MTPARRKRVTVRPMSDTTPSPTPIAAPQLSMGLVNFAAADPGGWEHLLERARLFDTVGVDRLTVSDHIAFGENLDAYGRPESGGIAGGKQPTGPDGHWLEPMTLLAVIAGSTLRIRLATNILIAALRRPAVLAKQASTLDVLSGGRLDLGVGVGWQQAEYDVAGLDFSKLGRLLNETLEVCQTLWRDHRATHESPALSFDGIHTMPKPLQSGGVPIWVSGRANARVAHRLSLFGTGWIPWGDDAAQPAAGIDRMRQALADIDHDATDLQVVGRLPTLMTTDGTIDIDRTMDAVPMLVAAGVTDVRMSVPVPTDQSEAAEHLTAIVAAFHEITGRQRA